MAKGQQALGAAALLTPAVARLEDRLMAREADRRRAHARLLEDALELERAYQAAGVGAFTSGQLAWLWDCSEARAERLLRQAHGLAALPAAMESLRFGVLGVEQSEVLVEELTGLDPVLAERVTAAALALTPQPAPAGFRRIVRREALRLAPELAQERRERAAAARDVTWWREQDSMIAIKATVPAAVARAVLDRIRTAAEPIGAHDDRTASQRRTDAFVDLLMGRAGGSCAAGDGSCEPPAVRCGCPTGSPVPCGAGVLVTVPVATALGLSQAPGELAGYGPVDADLARQVLRADPVLWRVCVDATTGTPLSIDPRPVRPGRDPDALRQALQGMVLTAEVSPDDRHPTHADDHAAVDPGPPRHAGPRSSPPHDDLAAGTTVPPPDAARGDTVPPPDIVGGASVPPPDTAGPPGHAAATSPTSVTEPHVLTTPHPAGTSGPYRVPTPLRRFLTVRAVVCEFPGCNRPSRRCDMDHDVAWPHGPTCACNVGPLCRRHHRMKQAGWRKQRCPGGVVRWTSPTGRTREDHQHPAPPPVLPSAALALLAPTPASAPPDNCPPLELLEPWWDDPDLPDDPAWLSDEPGPCDDVEPDDTDSAGDRLGGLFLDPTWTLDLDDPTQWEHSA